MGAAHGALARVLADGAAGWDLPCALLSSGETTVTMRGAGRGGRNAEYLLALALALDAAPSVHALAADTDGIDGSEDNAGAWIAPDSPARAMAAGLDPGALLGDNDSYTFFSRLGDLLVTGPTRTNVNDFRAVLVGTPPIRSALAESLCSPGALCSRFTDARRSGQSSMDAARVKSVTLRRSTWIITSRERAWQRSASEDTGPGEVLTGCGRDQGEPGDRSAAHGWCAGAVRRPRQGRRRSSPCASKRRPTPSSRSCASAPRPRARPIKDLLAMGADEATVVGDPYEGSADAAVVARVLEAALDKRGPFDLIICGFASDDGYSYQTGPRLAERLKLPLVSYASAAHGRRRRPDGRPRPRGRCRDRERVAAGDRERRRRSLPAASRHAAPGDEGPEEAHQRLGPSRTSAWPARRSTRSRATRLVAESGIVVDRQQRVLKGTELAEMADQLIDALVDEQRPRSGRRCVMSAGILVWSEQRRAGPGAARAGAAPRRRAWRRGRLCASAARSAPAELEAYAAHGADVVYDSTGSVDDAAQWVAALAAVIAQAQPSLVLDRRHQDGHGGGAAGRRARRRRLRRLGGRDQASTTTSGDSRPAACCTPAPGLATYGSRAL